jgi:hypothetical protein
MLFKKLLQFICDYLHSVPTYAQSTGGTAITSTSYKKQKYAITFCTVVKVRWERYDAYEGGRNVTLPSGTQSTSSP